MKWDRPRIIQKLRKLHRSGAAMCYADLARSNQSLLSAAVYHFGSYRAAIEKARINYAEVLQRPRWTRPRIIALIKLAKRDGQDLHWGAVTRRRDELGKAAFASLQRRLFGRWDRALHAAGLDADDVACYRTWDRNTIAFELRARSREGEPLSSGAMQKEDPALHAAAVRYFGTYDRALRAARLDPDELRLRRAWSKEAVIKGLKRAARVNKSASASAIRRNDPALYGAALRLFGSIGAARQAAKISGPRA